MTEDITEEKERSITIVDTESIEHLVIIGCGSEEISTFTKAMFPHPEPKVIILGDGLDKPTTTWRQSPFDPEPFIFSARPTFEEPFIPKHISNAPWYTCFSNKKRHKR